MTSENCLIKSQKRIYTLRQHKESIARTMGVKNSHLNSKIGFLIYAHPDSAVDDQVVLRCCSVQGQEPH